VSLLRNIERTIGGLFEGVFSRTFRSTVQPVELARKLAKEMNDHKTISIHRVYVPDEYTIFLNPADREQFTAYETQMRNELAEYLVEHARREGYTLSARPLVLLETDEDLTVGTFGIAVSTQSPAVRAEAEAAAPAAEPQAEAMPVPPPMLAPELDDIPAEPAPVPAVPPIPPGATMIYAPSSAPEPEPAPEPATGETATLEWPGGSVTIDQRVIVIGRSSDCDVQLDDANVSRRHAEVRHIGDGYSLVDLGSTNGTEVNGQRIQETALMNGDVIAVGTTRITFERRLG
jgi:predicted component of type VI protein secretion system